MEPPFVTPTRQKLQDEKSIPSTFCNGASRLFGAPFGPNGLAGLRTYLRCTALLSSDPDPSRQRSEAQARVVVSDRGALILKMLPIPVNRAGGIGAWRRFFKFYPRH